jgi:hypothetical protein
MDIYQHKHELVRQTYLETADKNYILARSAFFYKMYWDFFWLSTHAIEKYFKGILLLNDRPAIVGGHNLACLHKQVLDLDSRLTFEPLDISEIEMTPKIIRDKPREVRVRWVLDRLNRLGSPENRYGLLGYHVHPDDLFVVDQLVWAVRRHCRRLKVPVQEPSGEQVIIDEVDQLRRDSMRWSVSPFLGVEKILSLSEEDLSRSIFVRFNLPFAPDIDHGTFRWSFAWANSPIAYWFEVLRDETKPMEKRKEAAEVIRWMKDNIFLAKSEKREVEAELATFAASGSG